MDVRTLKKTITGGLLAVAVLAAGACKDNSTQPLVPTALTEISGDGQDATVGTAASSPLVVEVKDNDGNAMPNVVVKWSITQGAGTLSPDSTMTGSDGMAESTFTPSAAGQEVVAATVSGLASVSFDITADDAAQPGT